MSSLGEIYFSLGLDDKQFNSAIEAAKKKVADLGADVSLGINIDTDSIGKQIKAEFDKIRGGSNIKIGVDDSELKQVREDLAKAKAELAELNSAKFKNTSEISRKEGWISQLEKREKAALANLQTEAKPIQVDVELNQEAVAKVRQQLSALSAPIKTKLTVEYDNDKFQAATTAIKNYTDSLNNLGKIRLGIDDSFLRTEVGNTNGKGISGFFGKMSDYLLGDDMGEVGKSMGQIQRMLNNYTFKLKTEVDEAVLINSLNAISKKRIPLGVSVNIDTEAVQKKLNTLKIPLTFNSKQAIDDVKSKLKKETFNAKLNLVIDRAKISKVIKEAFAQKGLEYAASPSDVRNARILEIQQRMEHRQKKFDKQVKNSASSTRKLSSNMMQASNWASQLSNQFANFISIYTIERFIRNLYTIGGEFQKQHIAIRNMIGDADKANSIFERMKELAVFSPFTFSELSSYTKQMAAYGIQYEELYDTTKRLADISAGVGVDMSRLILAYGQVRSAEVLRGQELRQFTEAGIPLVAELAKKLSDVRGEAVKVGEVFKAISKREISFGMVKDVLFDMTDPGGRFFEMQEELAKSLAGQWSNLKDAWDIMIADIANSSNNVLTNFARIANDLLRSWREWVPAVVAVGTAIGTLTTVIRLSTIATAAWNAVITANPWTLAIGGILAAAGAIGAWAVVSEMAQKNATQLNSELDTEIQKWNENRENALRYVDTLKSSNTSEERRIKLYEELIKLYPELFEAMSLEQAMLKDTAKLKTDINEATADAQIQSINDAIDNYQKEIDDIEKARRRETDKGVIIYKLTEDEQNRLDEAKKQISELNKRKEDVQKIIDRADKVSKLTPDSNIEQYIDLYGDLAKAVKILKQGGVLGKIANPDEFTTTLEYYNQLNTALKEQESITEKFKKGTPEYEDASKLVKVYRNAISAIGGLWKERKSSEGKSGIDEAAKADVQAYIEALKQEISAQSQKWDLFKELLEATGDKTLATRIAFDDKLIVDSPYLDELKKRLREEADKLGVGISVEELLGMGEKQLANDSRIGKDSREKVSKILGTIINAYNEENKKLKSETIKDFLDIINSSKDFARQIEDIERNLQKQLDALASVHGKGTPEYNRAANEAIKRAEEEKTKIRFEEFKESSDWVKVFDDLDRVSDATLDNMIAKVEEFAKQAHLSEEVTKQLVDAMAKLREETIERNPFKGFKDAWDRLKYLKSGTLTESGMVRFGKGTKDDPYTFKTNKEVQDGVAETNENLEKSSLAVAKKFQAVADAADLLTGLFENMGVNMDGFLGTISGMIGGAASGAQTGAGIAQAFGAAGPWGAIAGAAVGMLSSVFAMHDKALQKEIEASEARGKAIKNVSDNLEALLERTIGSIYTISLDADSKAMLRGILYKKEGNIFKRNDLYSSETRRKAEEALREDSYYDAQLAALMAQRDEIQKQMKLEDDKKKTDKSKMDDYEQQIVEIEAAINTFARDMAESLYGIDFKEWANQLADALVNAWATGEDAVEAYKNTVTDILKNLGVSVISQKIIEPLLEDTMNQFLAQFKLDNGKLTDNSLDILAGMYDEAEYAAKATEAYLEGLKKLGIDLSDTSGDSSKEGLSKGIQAVTEDTANLLASYINGIRADVSVKRYLIEKLIAEDIPQMSVIAQMQLTQLNNIAANTLRNADAADRIYELFNRVVDKGGNKLKI